MSQERTNLEPSVIGQLYQILWPNLDNNQQRQLLGITRSWGVQKRQLVELEASLQKPDPTAFEDIEYATDLLENIDSRRSATQNFIYNPQFHWSKGSLAAMRGLSRAKSGIVKEHPFFIPLTREQQNTEAYLADARSRLTTSAEAKRVTKQPQINRAQDGLQKTESKLLEFSERQVLPSLELSRRYVTVLPSRNQTLIALYGDTFGLESDRAVSIDEFMERISNFVEQRAKRDRSYLKLKEGSKPFSQLSVSELPNPYKHRLQIWSSYQFALALAEDNSIPLPELPDIFI